MEKDENAAHGTLAGGVLIYRNASGEFVNVALGSAEIRSLTEWFKGERLKGVLDNWVGPFKCI